MTFCHLIPGFPKSFILITTFRKFPSAIQIAPQICPNNRSHSLRTAELPNHIFLLFLTCIFQIIPIISNGVCFLLLLEIFRE